MKTFKVTGMTCAACSARVEKAVKTVDGVEECAVNLLSGGMSVKGSADAESIVAAVKRAGYGCSADDGKGKGTDSTSENTYSTEFAMLVRRLASSLLFLAVLMYFAMGHNMLGLPLPGFFNGNPVATGLVQLLCCIAVMILGSRFFISGVKSVIRLSPNMDALVALGSFSAFAYSTAVLFVMSSELAKGNAPEAKMLLHDLYFESAAMILVLITVGKALEARSKARTGDALKSLEKLMPETACVIRDGKEERISISDVRVGDIFVVKPGEQIPVDGCITQGSTAVNEAAITGESVPAEKGVGDTVVGATLNTSGYIKCRAVSVGNDTVLSKIIKTVNDACASKAPIAKTADKIAAVFVPAVMVIALVTAAIWLMLGYGFGFALARGVSVLVISCPCSLGLATPVAIMVGSGVGAKNGILFKTAEALEICGRVNTVVLDKTGTVTSGSISVTGVYPCTSESELLSVAYTLEKMSEHPLARAVALYCEEKNTALIGSSDFRADVGSGVYCRIGEDRCFGGKAEYLAKNGITVPDEQMKRAEEISLSGSTPLFFARADIFLGTIAVCDTVRPDSADAIAKMTESGLETVLLSGDNEIVTKAMAKRTGISRAIYGATPQSKAETVRELRKEGRIAMVGDGINDAPALAQADVGIAIGSGTDIARDTAGVILVNGNLTSALNAIRLSKAVLRNIRQNLFWAFFYNCIGIPIAAGALVSVGVTLSPAIGALAMGLSSFCVVSNALRLNSFKAYKAVHEESVVSADNNTEEDREVKVMQKEYKVKGMMCVHCENHVKKALLAIDGISEATASYTEEKVTVTLEKEISDEVIKKAITDEGYEVE